MGELHGLRFSDITFAKGIPTLRIARQFSLARGQEDEKIDTPKTKWSHRLIPLHPELQVALEAWRVSGWRQHVGREPTGNDFILPDTKGQPYREDRADWFRTILESVGAPTTYEGHPLGPGALRKTFMTAAMEADVAEGVRRRLLGHGPSNTAERSYELKRIDFLFREISKIPGILEAPPVMAPVIPLQTAVSARGS